MQMRILDLGAPYTKATLDCHTRYVDRNSERLRIPRLARIQQVRLVSLGLPRYFFRFVPEFLGGVRHHDQTCGLFPIPVSRFRRRIKQTTHLMPKQLSIRRVTCRFNGVDRVESCIFTRYAHEVRVNQIACVVQFSLSQPLFATMQLRRIVVDAGNACSRCLGESHQRAADTATDVCDLHSFS